MRVTSFSENEMNIWIPLCNVRHLNVQFQKISITPPPHGRSMEIPRGRGANRRKFPRGCGVFLWRISSEGKEIRAKIVSEESWLTRIFSCHCGKIIIIQDKSSVNDESFCPMNHSVINPLERKFQGGRALTHWSPAVSWGFPKFGKIGKVLISYPICSKNTELTGQKKQHPFGLK